MKDHLKLTDISVDLGGHRIVNEISFSLETGEAMIISNVPRSRSPAVKSMAG